MAKPTAERAAYAATVVAGEPVRRYVTFLLHVAGLGGKDRKKGVTDFSR